MTEETEAQWQGIGTVVAIVCLSAVTVVSIMQNYDCQWVTIMVVGIAGLGGFTYRQYMRQNGNSGESDNS